MLFDKDRQEEKPIDLVPVDSELVDWPSFTRYLHCMLSIASVTIGE